jgi:hypothetical protein
MIYSPMNSRTPSQSDTTSPFDSPMLPHLPQRSIRGTPAHTSSTDELPPQSFSSLTQESLAQLAISQDLSPRPPRWQAFDAGPSRGSSGAIRNTRRSSVTPSATSISDGGDDFEENMSVAVNILAGQSLQDKGKGKMLSDQDLKQDRRKAEPGLAANLPPEILIQVGSC